MNCRPIFDMQPLESRRLLAGHPAGRGEPCPEVIEARENLHELSAQLREDRQAVRTELAAARHAVNDAIHHARQELGKAWTEALAPLQQQLRDDLRAQRSETAAARKAIADKRAQFAPLLEADRQALAAARAAGDRAAAQAAKAKLAQDRNQLNVEVLPLKEDLAEVLAKWEPILQADRDAIQAKMTELAPDLAGVFDELEGIIASGEAKLVAGHNAVVNAQQALKEAIEQCLQEHQQTA